MNIFLKTVNFQLILGLISIKILIVLKERREYKIKYHKVIQIKNMLKQKGINFDASRIKEESSYGVRFLKDEFEMYKDYIKFPWKNK